MNDSIAWAWVSDWISKRKWAKDAHSSALFPKCGYNRICCLKFPLPCLLSHMDYIHPNYDMKKKYPLKLLFLRYLITATRKVTNACVFYLKFPPGICHEKTWTLSNTFATSIIIILLFLSMILSMCCVASINLHIWEQPYSSGMKPTWS